MAANLSGKEFVSNVLLSLTHKKWTSKRVPSLFRSPSLKEWGRCRRRDTKDVMVAIWPQGRALSSSHPLLKNSQPWFLYWRLLHLTTDDHEHNEYSEQNTCREKLSNVKVIQTVAIGCCRQGPLLNAIQIFQTLQKILRQRVHCTQPPILLRFCLLLHLFSLFLSSYLLPNTVLYVYSVASLCPVLYRHFLPSENFWQEFKNFRSQCPLLGCKLERGHPILALFLRPTSIFRQTFTRCRPVVVTKSCISWRLALTSDSIRCYFLTPCCALIISAASRFLTKFIVKIG